MHATGEKNSERVSPFQIVILILSVVVLLALGADTFLKLPAEISRLLNYLDTIICIILLVDFGARFYRAESKLQFLKWGWIDLLASIPYVPALRIGRVVRIFQIIRLFRAVRATHKISAVLLKDKVRTGVAAAVLTAILLVMFCSIAVLICEQQDPNANIKTAGDALWWGITTITTVGYGDKYPITTGGRIIAIFLMIAGVGLFGVLSGLAASFFVGSSQKTMVHEENKILARLDKLEEKIDRLVKKE